LNLKLDFIPYKILKNLVAVSIIPVTTATVLPVEQYTYYIVISQSYPWYDRQRARKTKRVPISRDTRHNKYLAYKI
jgi:hypothetical protein